MVIGIKRILFEQISRFTHRVISPDDGGFRHEIECNESVTIVPKTIGGQRVEYRQDNQMVDANAERVKMYGADFQFITAYLTLEMIRDLCLGNYASQGSAILPKNMRYIAEPLVYGTITATSVFNIRQSSLTSVSAGQTLEIDRNNIDGAPVLNFANLRQEDRIRLIEYAEQYFVENPTTQRMPMGGGRWTTANQQVSNTCIQKIYVKGTGANGEVLNWKNTIPYNITFYAQYGKFQQSMENPTHYKMVMTYDRDAITALKVTDSTSNTESMYFLNNPDKFIVLDGAYNRNGIGLTTEYVNPKFFEIGVIGDLVLDARPVEIMFLLIKDAPTNTQNETQLGCGVMAMTVRIGEQTNNVITDRYASSAEYEQDIERYQDFIDIDDNELETFDTGFSGYDREKNLFRMTLTTDIYNGADNFGDYLMVAPCCWADNILYKLISMEFQDQPFTVHARDSFIRKLPAISIYKRGQILYYWEVIEGEDLIDVTEAGGNKMQFLY